MKKIKLIFGALALLALFASCGFGGAGGDILSAGDNDTGEISLQFIVPDYDHDITVSDGSRAIPPNIYEIRIYLDGDEFMTVPVSVIGGFETTLETQDGGPVVIESGTEDPDTVFNSPVVWGAEIQGVPTGYYDKLTVELYNEEAKLLAEGIAFDVSIDAFQTTALTVTNYVAAGNYDYVYTDGTSVSGASADSDIAFFKFYAREGVTYTMELSGITGSPDMYLFDSTSRLASELVTEDPVEYAYYIDIYGTGDSTIIYQAEQTGTLTLGVYGWSGAASYDLTVTSDVAVVDPSVALVDQAYNDLRNQDLDEALSTFSEALMENEANPEAALGYALMSLLSTALDPAFQTLVSDNLGVEGYPVTLNELLSTTWLENWVLEMYVGEDEETYESLYEEVEIFLPSIKGQEAFDGKLFGINMEQYLDEEDMDDDQYFAFSEDGLISPEEKGAAFVTYYVMNNDGFDDLFRTMSELLGAKFDQAAAILSSDALDDAKFTFTWDMVFATPEDAYASLYWPRRTDPDTGAVVLDSWAIGKAELLQLSAGFNILKFMVNTLGVYNWDMVNEEGESLIENYYLVFEEIFQRDGFDSAPDFMEILEKLEETPFSMRDFLAPADEADAHWAAAREAFMDAMEQEAQAMELVLAREEADGYYIGPGENAISENFSEPLFNDPDSDGFWSDLEVILEFEQRLFETARQSMVDGTDWLLPLPVDGIGSERDKLVAWCESYPDNWPTEEEVDVVFSVNWNFFFADIISIREFFELKGTGEPVFYTIDAASETVSPVGILDMSAGDTFQYETYYTRMNNPFFSGLFGTNDLAVDDPTDMGYLWLDWDDESFVEGNPERLNGYWDPGEEIYNIEFASGLRSNYYPLVLFGDSVVGLDKLADYTIDGSVVTPKEYYESYASNLTVADLRQICIDEDWRLERYLHPSTLTADMTALQAALVLKEDYEFWIEDYTSSYYSIYDPATESVYLNTPFFIFWSSMAPLGSEIYYEDANDDEGQGEWYTSLGSCWYSAFGFGSLLEVEEKMSVD